MRDLSPNCEPANGRDDSLPCERLGLRDEGTVRPAGRRPDARREEVARRCPPPVRHGRPDPFSGRSSPDDLGYTIGRPVRCLVFPDADHAPARLLEECGRLCIPLPIASYLLRPEAPVRHGRGVVDRAAMPEASVQEDCDARPNEQKISGRAQALQGSRRYAVAQATTVHGRPQSQLGRGVPSLVRLHRSADRRGGRPGLRPSALLLSLLGVHPVDPSSGDRVQVSDRSPG